MNGEFVAHYSFPTSIIAYRVQQKIKALQHNALLKNRYF